MVLAEDLSRLGTEAFITLRSFLQTLADCNDGKFSYGSFFSGSEMAHVVLMELFKLCREYFGIQIDVELAFVAEKERARRKFILDHCHPTHVFEDVLQLRSDGWKGPDLLNEMTDTPVPHAHFFFAGFECDSVSGYNRGSEGQKTMGDCVSKEKGKTGQTAVATLEFIFERRFTCSILENVKTLGAQNINTIISRCNENGMFVRNMCRDAALFGSPEHRMRQYFLVFPVSDSPIEQFNEDFEAPGWVNEFVQVLDSLQMDAISVENVLFPDGHPMLSTDEETQLQKRPTKKSKTDEWQAEHLDAFRRHGLRWPPVFPEQFEARTCGLPRRQQEAAWLWEQTCLKKAADEPDSAFQYLVDVNNSFEWSNESKTPSARLLAAAPTTSFGQAPIQSGQLEVHDDAPGPSFRMSCCWHRDSHGRFCATSLWRERSSQSSQGMHSTDSSSARS